MLGQDRLQERARKINEDIAYLTVDVLSIGEGINKLQLKTSIYEDNINKYENIKSNCADLCARLNALVVERKGIDELVVSTKSNVDNINTLMQNANTKHATVSAELEQIKAGMITVVSLRQEYARVTTSVSLLEEELRGKEEQKEKLHGIIASDETRIKINTEKLKEFEKISLDYGIYINEQHVYDILTTAFGPNGVPAMQIEAMKDQIEVLANNILQYGGQKLSVSILLKEPKKSGDGVKDVFKILVKTGDRIIPLFRLSGGEAYWVDLSVRAALFLVWRVRNPDNILDVLMIDEGLGKIDDGKRRILIDVLKYLSTKVKRILVITHTDLKNLVDEFDNVITVQKINGVSTV
jgi:exonuclease SbcC